jgi:hypothetical protein
MQFNLEDLPPVLPPRINETEDRRAKCRAIRKDLVNKINYVIDMIAGKVMSRNIELRLSNIVVLSLHLQIYLAQPTTSNEITMMLDYIEDKPAFYLSFPSLNESIFIEASYLNTNDDIVV